MRSLFRGALHLIEPEPTAMGLVAPCRGSLQEREGRRRGRYLETKKPLMEGRGIDVRLGLFFLTGLEDALYFRRCPTFRQGALGILGIGSGILGAREPPDPSPFEAGFLGHHP